LRCRFQAVPPSRARVVLETDAARARETAQAGADHVCVQPLGDTWVADVERLAPVLLQR